MWMIVLIVGDEPAVVDAIALIKKQFNIKQLGRDFTEYLRCTLKKTGDGIEILQDKLIKTIPQTFEIPDKTFNAPAAPVVKAKRRECVADS